MNFNFDNKFFRGLAKVIDCFALSALWFFCCLPIFTIGASSVAMYYTVHKTLIRGRGYIWPTFWTAFKENFKQSTLIWLVQMVMYGVLFFDVYMTWENLKVGATMGYMFYPFLVLLFLVIGWSLVLVGYASRFNNTKRAIMKNAALIALVNVPRVLLLLVLFVVSILTVYMIWPMIFLMPAVMFWIMDNVLEKVFRKYMTPEDLAAEEAADQIDGDELK